MAEVRSGSPELSALWLWLSSTAALVAAAGNVVGLVAADSIHGEETVGFADVAAAQDIVNLLLVAPLMVVLGARALRGDLPGISLGEDAHEPGTLTAVVMGRKSLRSPAR